jgi:hypothetical protein
MSEFSRRTLMGGAVALATSALWTEPVHAQYVWQKAGWQAADFDALTRMPRRIKQVVHGHDIGTAGFLRNIKNSLNGLHFGTGIPLEQIQIVCALNQAANVLNYSDYVWEKYRIGERMQVNDPKTGQPATRNIFYPSAAGTPLHYTSEDPSNDNSAYQDTSIQGLQARGVRFLSCHTSTEEQARGLARQNGASVSPEEIVKDMEAHTLPGVLVVPSVAGALAALQCDGHYSYMAA